MAFASCSLSALKSGGLVVSLVINMYLVAHISELDIWARMGPAVSWSTGGESSADFHRGNYSKHVATAARPWLDSPYEFHTVPANVLFSLETLIATASSQRSQRTLTVTVHGFHGGLGDRIRGVYACALLALLTDRLLYVTPHILLKQKDDLGVDASVIDKGDDCYDLLLPAVDSKKRHIRISTSCDSVGESVQRMIDTRVQQLPPQRAAAVHSLYAHCGGELKVGDLSQSNCADYSGSGCFTIHKSYQCGTMLLHAAYAAQQPEMAHMLWGVRRMYDSWRALLAPDGYNAIHFRTGHSTLHLDEKLTLPSTPWEDAEWCGQRCTDWLQRADGIAKTHTIKTPVALTSDSSVLVGLLQSRMWNSLRLLHCCAGAVHVARGGTIAHEQDMAILRQNVFDLAVIGGADRLFVDLGHFWSLGMFWWSNLTSTTVHIDKGPASTIPLLV